MIFINLDAIKEKDFDNRFDGEKFIPFSNNVYDILDSYFTRKVKTLPVWGKTSVKGEEARPDLLSYRIYGKTIYWYIIMIYNNYISVDDIKEGDVIQVPSVDAIEELYFSLNTLQKTQDLVKVIK